MPIGRPGEHDSVVRLEHKGAFDQFSAVLVIRALHGVEERKRAHDATQRIIVLVALFGMSFDIEDDRVDLGHDRRGNLLVDQVQPVGRQLERPVPDRACVGPEVEQTHADPVDAAAA